MGRFLRVFQRQSRVFREINHECIIVEEFFKSILTRTVPCALKDSGITEKAETFVHYTYEKSNKRLMVTDLQGVGYHLCDPEIAIETIVEEKSHKSKMHVEYPFCAGNLSTTAFENFERDYVCNRYCIKLELAQLYDDNCIFNSISKVIYLVNARM